MTTLTDRDEPHSFWDSREMAQDVVTTALRRRRADFLAFAEGPEHELVLRFVSPFPVGRLRLTTDPDVYVLRNDATVVMRKTQDGQVYVHTSYPGS